MIVISGIVCLVCQLFLSCHVVSAASLGAMKADSPFFHYLRNRCGEFDKAGKDWKFSLITAVHATLQSAGPLLLLNTADEQEVRAIVLQMVQQGAYYMPPRVEDPQTMES